MGSDSGRGRRKAAAAYLAAGLVLGALVLALGASGAAPAGEGAATRRIAALVVSPQDGTLWVGTAREVLRSGDQGRTLASVALPVKAAATEVTAVAVEPRSPWAVYVATTGEGIFKSEDGGKSWSAVNNGLDGLDIRGVAVSPKDARLHAQVRGQGLFRSMDGARTWERVDDGPAGAMFVLASVNISTGMGGIFLYAGTDQGLVRGPD
jgi:photosystem II stability/assembly factor-like uncharacterized protein